MLKNMYNLFTFIIILVVFITYTNSNDVLGCGGFVKSHVQIDFSKVEVKLLTQQGILKDKTTCAPNNGYYFLPIYDKGDYIVELNPPSGWSFNPTRVELTIDKVNDICSRGVDINFNFNGFGITGKVESFGHSSHGPEGVLVELISENEIRKTETSVGGVFSFTPVYPGHYKIKIQHQRWKLLKSELQVKVTEGNTELPVSSLIVHGYSVHGFARSDGEAVANTTILLFSEKSQANDDDVFGCDKNPILGLNMPKKPLCHVKTDSSGRFTFGSVAVGKYYVSPFYLNQNMDVEPNKIEFTVPHKDIELQENFEVIGFSIIGKVIRSHDAVKPEGIPNVKIYINGKYVTQTDSKGSYKLEKLKTGVFQVRPTADNLIFEEISLKINPNLQSLPDITPSAFKICGKVDSDQSQAVTIVKVGSTLLKNVKSDSLTGIFCEYLPRGTYEIQIQVKNSDKEKGLQFYPISQKIEVSHEDDNTVLFSQLKAVVVGKVQCLRADDCKNLQVLMRPSSSNDESISAKLKEQGYELKEVLPGPYKVSLSKNRFCWVKDTHDVMINSIKVTAPNFVQSGYSVKFISSHNTKVSHKFSGDSITQDLEIKEGESTYCLPKDGSYVFEYLGCHAYKVKTFTFNTQSEPNEIRLEAIAHLNRLCITSDSNHGPVTALIDKDGEKIQTGQLSYSNGCYNLEILLEPEANAIILPQSEIYYFKPPIFSVKGKNDCSQLGSVFQAIKGHVFKGKIVPALPGTLITLEDDNGESLTTETDSLGFYKFPPMDRSKKYKITAKKELYQLVGPSENGDFTAYKLAQIIVEVLDDDRSPLQGTLLSLSGGLSYRSNLQTDEKGIITFHSLNPSEYYLRPMMKEYSFEPASKIIQIKEGETINITLIGKRVAYSALGIVTSLNKIPEYNSVVEAVGIGNCSHFSEETSTDFNGKFRVRGLQPFCTYQLRIKDPSVEQSIPEFIEIKDIGNDVEDLHLVALRPRKQTKLLVRITTDVPEYAKLLKLSIYLKGPQLTLINSIKLDPYIKVPKDFNAGIILYPPVIPKDEKTYIFKLESTSTQNLKWVMRNAQFVANSTFKLVHLKYSLKTNLTEQHIDQLTHWLVIVIAIIIFSFHFDSIYCRILANTFNIKFDSFGTLILSMFYKPVDYPVNDEDIDQIVQSINAVKRKTKRS